MMTSSSFSLRVVESGRRFAGALLIGVLMLGAGMFSPAQAQDTAQPVEFSEAETLLWLGDQLKSVTAPVRLEYDFVKSGTYEEGFTDKVVFNIHKVKPDGMKAASLDFFTGSRRFEIPPEENTNVNPVLKVYMQGDVYEMNRLTDPDGKSRERWRYFQRRIKFALADAADVKPVEIPFDGKTYRGKRVTFAPYVNDPKADKFKQFTGKTYSITVSDELPGFIYEIETRVPGATAEAPPLIKETLRLGRVSSL